MAQTDRAFRAELDRLLKDPFTRALCDQVSRWQDQFSVMEEEREKLNEKLDAGYKLACAIADDFGIELVERFRKTR